LQKNLVSDDEVEPDPESKEPDTASVLAATRNIDITPFIKKSEDEDPQK
jgi:hypothetical protein